MKFAKSYGSKRDAVKAGRVLVKITRQTEVQGLMRYSGDVLATSKEYAELIVSRGDGEVTK